jgi:hypothetical protein
MVERITSKGGGGGGGGGEGGGEAGEEMITYRKTMTAHR